jgi:hypothetical protein
MGLRKSLDRTGDNRTILSIPGRRRTDPLTEVGRHRSSPTSVSLDGRGTEVDNTRGQAIHAEVRFWGVLRVLWVRMVRYGVIQSKIRVLEKITMTSRSIKPGEHSSSLSFGGMLTETSAPSRVDTTAGFHKLDPRQGCDIDPETGQIRPISAEELQARHEELTRRLAEIDAEDNTPPEVYDDFMRNLDDERRRQGRPPAFENCY